MQPKKLSTTYANVRIANINGMDCIAHTTDTKILVQSAALVLRPLAIARKPTAEMTWGETANTQAKGKKTT